MRIPKRFDQLGKTIDVEFSESLTSDEGIYGKAIIDDNKIILQKSVPGYLRPKSSVDEVFCHELIHIIFHYASYKDELDPPLYLREGIVHRAGCLLHQALTTMEYEDKDNGCACSCTEHGETS